MPEASCLPLIFAKCDTSSTRRKLVFKDSLVLAFWSETFTWVQERLLFLECTAALKQRKGDFSGYVGPWGQTSHIWALYQNLHSLGTTLPPGYKQAVTSRSSSGSLSKDQCRRWVSGGWWKLELFGIPERGETSLRILLLRMLKPRLLLECHINVYWIQNNNWTSSIFMSWLCKVGITALDKSVSL